MKLKLLLVANASERLEEARDTLASITSLQMRSVADLESALESIEVDPPDLLILDAADINATALEFVTVVEALGLPTRLLLLSPTLPGPGGATEVGALPFAVQLCRTPATANMILEILDHTLALRELESPTPKHTVADYLLVTAVGRCSLSLQCSLGSGDALFEMVEGELWSAFFGDQTGVAAAKLAARNPVLSVTTRRLSRQPEERQIQEETISLLVSAATEAHEASGEVQPAPKPLQDLGTLPIEISPPPKPDTQEVLAARQTFSAQETDSFTAHFSKGTRAALSREYQAAAEAFRAALQLRPRDTSARFNLERILKLLGVERS